jgi:hypothetical protein
MKKIMFLAMMISLNGIAHGATTLNQTIEEHNKSKETQAIKDEPESWGTTIKGSVLEFIKGGILGVGTGRFGYMPRGSNASCPMPILDNIIAGTIATTYFRPEKKGWTANICYWIGACAGFTIS